MRKFSMMAMAMLLVAGIFLSTATAVYAGTKDDDKYKDDAKTEYKDKYDKPDTDKEATIRDFTITVNPISGQLTLVSNGIFIVIDAAVLNDPAASPALQAIAAFIGQDSVSIKSYWDEKNSVLSLSVIESEKETEKDAEYNAEKIDVTYRFIGRTVTIQSVQNGRYVSARQDKHNSPVNAQASRANNWERFRVVAGGDGTAALRANNNRYISAVLGDRHVPLRAVAHRINNWERFQIFQYNGNYYIQAANGNWVSASVNTSDAPLRATATEPSAWERFIITIL